MTLDQYIETLSSMRDRYQAGDFEMHVDLGVHVITGQPESRPMDGDDFFLDLDTHRCVVGDSCVHPAAFIRSQVR